MIDMEATKKQLAPLRAKYPDALFLVRNGDDYEAYGDDAQKVAKVCRLSATYDRWLHDSVVQIRHYQLDTYLPKLIRAKYRVCICDGLDAPKPRQQPAEVVTPSTDAL